MSRALKAFIFATIVAATIARHDIAFDAEPPVEPEAPNVTISRCNALNQHRVELNKCCNYPHINLHRVLVDSCLDECVASKDQCCPIGECRCCHKS
jgi:hypothetical protein